MMVAPRGGYSGGSRRCASVMAVAGATVMLVLLAAVAGDAAAAGGDLGGGAPMRASRRDLQDAVTAADTCSSVPATALRVKIYCGRTACPDPSQDPEWTFFNLESIVSGDVAAVDQYACQNAGTRLRFDGAVADADLVKELGDGTFDVLLVYTWYRIRYEGPLYDLFTANQRVALESSGLKHLLVWQGLYSRNVPNHVPGMSTLDCWGHGDLENPYVFNNTALPAIYAGVDVNGLASDTVIGYAVSHGYCTRASLMQLPALAQAAVYTVAEQHDEYPSSTSVGSPTAFSYCNNRLRVFFMHAPMDIYLMNLFDYERLYPTMHTLHRNTLYTVTSQQAPCNVPPSCPEVVLSQSWLPPNNKMTTVTLQNVITGAAAKDMTLEVLGVDFYESVQGKVTLPLAKVDGLQVSLQAARFGAGSGRLYRIKYRVTGTSPTTAGICVGYAYVCIPHDASAFSAVPLDPAITNAQQLMQRRPRKKACPTSIAANQWKPAL